MNDRGDQAAIAPLGIIVVVATGVVLSSAAAVTLYVAETPSEPTATGFHVENTHDGFTVTLTKGDALPTATTWLRLQVDGQEHALATSTVDGLGSQWDQGEEVCLLGPEASCDHGLELGSLRAFSVATDDQLVYEWTGTPKYQPSPGVGGSGGAGPPGGQGSPGHGAGEGEDDEDEEVDEGEGQAPGEEPPEEEDPPGQADLSATTPEPSPTSPAHGQDVTFSTTVSNTGQASTQDPFDVRFFVDGQLLSTETLAPVPAGGTVNVISHAWTATAGEHEVRVEVDTGQEISEEDEGNNAADLDLAVAQGIADPGHAYEDVNNDLLYTEGTDIAIPDEEILDGTYEVAPATHGLVVPPSLGDLSAERVTLASGAGGHLVLQVNLTTTDERVQLVGGTRVLAENVTVRSPDERINVTAGTHVLLNDTRLESQGERVLVTAGGALHAAGATLTSQDERVLLTAGTTIDLTGATVSVNEKTQLTSDGDIDLTRASIAAGEEILVGLGSDGHTLTVTDATLEDEDDTAEVTPAATTVQGTPESGQAET